MSFMETVEYFSDFLRKIGAPNFLAIGIVLIVLWLLISGIRKGLRKGKQGKESEKKNDEG
jgi:Na+/H+ antiporter NhaD/arsenite permease-like protein